ncbi:MAG: serine hydrolase domain-containing protein [Chloroflexota bacterium]
MLGLLLLAVVATGGALVGVPELRDAVGLGPSSTPAATGTGAGSSIAPSAVPTDAQGPSLRPNSPYIPAAIDRTGVRDRLQVVLDQGRASLAAPALSASILFPDGRMWTGVSGVADLATNRPLTPQTPFPLASVSKTFLAAEILALVGEGRLRLDAPASPLLPGVIVGAKPIDPRITIRQLLDHTSGLGDFLVDKKLDVAVLAEPTAVWTPERALAYAGRSVGLPGAGYHYSNTNYVLLGLIAERLTGRTLAQEYRTRFLEPLGLRTITYQGVEPPTAEMPTAYRYSSVALAARPIDITDGTDVRPFTAITTAAGAAGSVAASSGDLALWARALYSGDVIPEDLVGAMVADAAATAKLRPGYPYGLGVQVLQINGRTAIGHSGRLVGARSAMRWFPDLGIAITVLTNESRFDPTPVLEALLAVVAPQSFHPRPRLD